MLEGLTWLGHASFRLDDKLRIYFDPWKLETFAPADVILITHGHHDHCSPGDVAKLATDKTRIICTEDCADKFETGQVTTIKPGDRLDLGSGVTLEVVPAYNIGKPFHSRDDQHVGYIVDMGDRRIYHAGDTDLIPEMDSITCDVALLPIGGKFTMDEKDAARAVRRIKPEVVVPMHWGGIIGTRRTATRFQELVGETAEVVIMEPAP